VSVLEELAALEDHGAFIGRHVAPSEAEIAAMLRVVGADSLDDLAARTLPAAIAGADLSALPAPATEAEAMAELRALSERNARVKSLLGLGYHNTHVPPVIQRNVFENPGWYTAYTPYQAEIAQGRLEALVNFQTVVADLTGLPVANASLLDEATAAAEAVALAKAAHRGKADTLLAAADVHPQTLAVVRVRAEPSGIAVRVVPPAEIAAAAEAEKPFAVLLQYPGTTGEARDLAPEIAAAHKAGAMAVVCADPLSLCLLTPPGEMGADVVVGSTQRFGVPLGYGGPHAAYMAVKDAHKRLLPGRLVGVSRDAAGQPAMRLALQTREQHIRREKATSNICTAQVLLAVMAGMYAVWHGPEGLARVARRVRLQAGMLADAAARAGFALRHGTYFDTVAIEAGEARAEALVRAALRRGFNLRRVDAGCVAVSLDETVTRGELASLATAVAEAAGAEAADLASLAPAPELPPTLERRSPFLTAEVFNTHRSEHAMLRYLKRLEDRDVALNRSMIPLGSCTMKLNATAEMVPVSFPGFAEVHPFAPPEQAEGYAELTRRLEGWLCAVTGFAAVSLQPNAGSQGEYAGLLAIRAYHRARGQAERDVCLIPSSAHGTNPASAVMAGMKVVVVACDRDGNVDLADLGAKAEQHAARLAALMVTYPSTHGVFEEGIRGICALVHEHGGQVYMAGRHRRRRLPPEPPQDLLHPARRRRPRRRTDRRRRAPRAAPAEPPDAPRRGTGHRLRPGRRRALRQRRHPAHLLRLYPHDGGRGHGARHARGDPLGELPGEAAGRALPGALPRRARHGGARMHPRLPRLRAGRRSDGGGHRQAPAGLRLPRAHHVVAGDGHADGGAHRERAAGRAGPLRRSHGGDPRRDPRGGGGRRRPRR